MKLKFKYQKFQADAAKAVVDVFAGQPYLTPSYLMDRGQQKEVMIGDKWVSPGDTLGREKDFIGWANNRLVPGLTDEKVLSQIQKIQRQNLIQPSAKLEGRYNLTIEMETGVGKTYTYIKTMYELNKAYGWSKFIVVVPSIAIREGVYKTFQTTEDHFAEEYGQRIRYFIYNSKQLDQIHSFASTNTINAMIINAQAFNARGKDARRIYMKLDEFRSRRPIDVIAKTNPIMIIDEPQSVEGKKTKERLKEFHPLLTLRYSATPKEYYNLVYRLDAIDAYNKKLVKKIAVKGVTESGTTATDSFVYLEGLNLSQKAPTATLRFDCKGKSGIRQISRIVNEGYNLYDNSGELPEYKDNFVVTRIDGRDNSLEFLNGVKLYAGDIVGRVNEAQLRRIQIRETILSHIQKEQELFSQGIKVLSLFFIDEVDHYRIYDKQTGEPQNGIFATIFEEEYTDIVSHLQRKFDDKAYMAYLDAIPVEKTHAGYFSIDKKGHMINSKLKRRETTADDVSAYDLIMKNKERLLDLDPKKSPVRFIFSHSALREGWDNPNVFQICTLKSSSSEIRKRQEVGRGMRLCVNQKGERQDEQVLGKEVQQVNVLTVIASESYEAFARGLQSEIAETISGRPRAVNKELFIGRVLTNSQGEKMRVDEDTAAAIVYELTANRYIDRKGVLTEKYYTDKENGTLKLAGEVTGYEAAVTDILDSVYDERAMQPENARSNNIELKVEEEKLHSKAFQALWSKINAKSVYQVAFDTQELIHQAIEALNARLNVPKIYFAVESGSLEKIESREQLQAGQAFVKETSKTIGTQKMVLANPNVKYDLVGRLVSETGLTRKDVIRILTGITKATFAQFAYNPEEFIAKAAQLINEQKATAIIEHITYHLLDDRYDTDVFTEPTLRGQLGKNAIKTKKNLYDHLVFDSTKERDFASELDASQAVAVYVKLPDGFYISTPVGHYNPDWAIAFYEGSVKHIYFVAETKGSLSSLQLRQIEKAKIHCAKEHFKAISGGNVIYDVVDSYQTLLEKVMK